MDTDFLDKEPFPCFLEWTEWNDKLQRRFSSPKTVPNPGSICPANLYQIMTILTKREVIELLIEFGSADIMLGSERTHGPCFVIRFGDQ